MNTDKVAVDNLEGQSVAHRLRAQSLRPSRSVLGTDATVEEKPCGAATDRVNF